MFEFNQPSLINGGSFSGQTNYNYYRDPRYTYTFLAHPGWSGLTCLQYDCDDYAIPGWEISYFRNTQNNPQYVPNITPEFINNDDPFWFCAYWRGWTPYAITLTNLPSGETIKLRSFYGRWYIPSANLSRVYPNINHNQGENNMPNGTEVNNNQSTNEEEIDMQTCEQCRIDYNLETENFETVITMERTMAADRMTRMRRTQEWCETCSQTRTHSCEDCGELADYNYNLMNEVYDHYYCEDCYGSNCFWYCEDCDEHVDEDHEHEHYDHDGYRNGIVHDYSYKPTSVFHGNGPAFMGMELELESRGSMDPEEVAHLFVDRFGEDFFYAKEDSSLTNGVEIVSHPMDLDYWTNNMANVLAPLYKQCRDNGVKAWGQDGVGIHIHISKNAFRSMVHRALFGLFIMRNKGHVVAMTHRDSTYGNFDSMGSTVQKAGGRQSSGHFEAVSYAPRHSIEVRIFRSSLAIDRVIANLEFIDGLFNMTANMTTNDVLRHGFGWPNVVAYFEANTARYPRAVHMLQGKRFSVESILTQSFQEEN
jgi:hypothetical protein